MLEVLHEKNLLTDEQAYFMSDTKPEFELYNVKKDPFQLDNLADARPEVVAEFKNILGTWQAKTNNHYEDLDLLDLENMISQKRKGLGKWYLNNGGLSRNPSN